MVYIEKEKIKIKRNQCCRVVPEDDRKIQNILERRKKSIAKEMVRDIRSRQKEEAEKLCKVEKKLEIHRKHAEVARASLVDQWDRLKKDEEGFKAVFVQFHQFTIENRERVVRETAKFQISHDDKTEKEKAISEINKKITYFVNIFDRMKKELNKHTLYENFLIQYAECTQTKNINEILYRYALLLDSRDHLVDTTSRRQSTIVNCTKHFNHILQNWKGQLLKFGEELTTQSKKFEEAKRTVQHWEKTVNEIKTNAQRVWRDIDITRDALENIVCLLLIRMKAKVQPGFFEKDKTFQYLLTTMEGRIMYMNKMLGDLSKVKEEVMLICEKEGDGKGHIATETKPPKKKKLVSRKKRVVPLGSPKLSPGTAQILEELENRAKGIVQYEKWKSRGKSAKSENASRKSCDTISTFDSEGSMDSRPRAMTSWFITKHARKKYERRKSLEPSQPETKSTLVSSDSSHQSRKSGTISRVFSCVAITTDPSCHLIEERRTKMRDRIVERNFDRYEKFFQNKMDSDSSVLKINKETGKLELPKLKVKEKYIRQRKSIAITLPKIEGPRKQKRKDDDLSVKSATSHGSHKSGRSKKEEMDFESIKKFFSRPTVVQGYTYGNLS